MTRAVCETIRAVCETIRDLCETIRDLCETIRDLCETIRDLCETIRDLCETIRDLCEKTRDSCETIRDLCEKICDLCEKIRDLCDLRSHTTPEEDAHSPSWPNRLLTGIPVIVIIIKVMLISYMRFPTYGYFVLILYASTLGYSVCLTWLKVATS
jgi:RNA processing factor Prp31